MTFLPLRLRPFVLCLSIAASVPAHAETLDEAFAIAGQQDAALQASREQTAAAREQLSAAKSTRLPSLDFDGAYLLLDQAPQVAVELPAVLQMPPLQMALADRESTAYGLQLSVPLFTSGRITHGIRAAAAAHDGAGAQLRGSEEDLKLKVAQAYVNVLRSRHLQELAASSVATLSEHVADARNLFEKGFVARNDRLAAEVALANAQQDELRARNANELACAAYNRLLGRPFEAPVALDELVPAPSSAALDALRTQAVAQRSELQALGHQVDALREQAASVRAEQWPALGLFGGRYSWRNDRLVDDTFWAGGVTLSWKLFDGGLSGAKSRAYGRQADAADAMRRDAESLVRLQVQQEWLQLDETWSRVAVATQAREQAEENLRVARDRYTSGLGTNTEVLDAEALRVKTQTGYYDATYDNVLAGLRLRRAVGSL